MGTRVRNQRRGSRGAWIIAGVLVIMLALFASQGFSASMPVTPSPLVKPVPSVYRSLWSSANRVRVWTFTPALAGTLVTSITVSGAENSNGNRSLTLDLLDAAGAVLASGCAVTAGTSFSVSIDVVPDVTWSTVKTVRGTAIAGC